MSERMFDEDFAWDCLTELQAIAETKKKKKKLLTMNQYNYMQRKERHYNGEPPTKSERKHCDGTLCWHCQNSVPSADGSKGCEWSLYLQPVPGWDAIPRTIRNRVKKGESSITKSFHVISCPRFKEG